MVGKTHILRFEAGGNIQEEDLVVVEEPLQIILTHNERQNPAPQTQPLTLTMRTPGNDFELAIGLLLAEGIIHQYTDVKRIWHCQQAEPPENTVKVQLDPKIDLDLGKLQRQFLSTSSCGVCGKQNLEALEPKIYYNLKVNNLQVSSSIINSLNETLLSRQLSFRYTGAIHAAALFNRFGELDIIREDIGRHNAMDKVIGAALASRKFPLAESILFLSSRISFELVQKALMAGIPILAAVGAPSSLAVSLAERYGLTLIGFVRGDRFNVYTHPSRISFMVD